jgi:8-oxo-dGTP pyrophosphatase MutT (NUDIX family)
MRRNLNNQYQRAKLECLVFEMAFSEQPKRKYAKTKKEDGAMIVNIDKDNNVIGHFSKAEIHDPQEPKYHPAILVLPVTIGDDGLRIFIGDKNPKVYRRRAQDLLNGDHLNTSDEFWDCCGGHVEEQDLSKDKTVVDSDVFNHAARRELSEELILKGNAVDSEKLIGPLAIVEYGPATMPDAGINHEQSAVYTAVLPQNAEVTLRDDYPDTLGEHVVANFVTRSISFDQLMEMYRTLPEHFMDGLGRICAYFDANDFTEERFIASIKALDVVATPSV